MVFFFFQAFFSAREKGRREKKGEKSKNRVFLRGGLEILFLGAEEVDRKKGVVIKACRSIRKGREVGRFANKNSE